MRRVFIAGINGNMGKRYETILKNHLFIDVIGCDPFKEDVIKDGMKICDGVIIATPTSTHLELMEYFLRYGKPILCEKPFTTNLDQLDRFEYEHRDLLPLISMVNQYEYLTNESSRGLTSYDYFKSGGDGLVYDCINLIGQAHGEVELDNKSAVWSASINGQKLHLADIDLSYISMLKRWTQEPKSNYRYASNAHRKVDLWLKKQERLNARRDDRNPG